MQVRKQMCRLPRDVLFKSLAPSASTSEPDRVRPVASRNHSASSCVCCVQSCVGSVPRISAASVTRCVASTDTASLAKRLAANIKGAARTKLSARIAERLSKRSEFKLREFGWAPSAASLASMLRPVSPARREYPAGLSQSRLQ